MKNKDKKLTLFLVLFLIILIGGVIYYPIKKTILLDLNKKQMLESVNNIVLSAKEYYESNSSFDNEYVVFNIKDGKVLEDGLDYNGVLPNNGKILINNLGEVQIVASTKNWCITKRYNVDELLIDKYNNDCSIKNVIKMANVNISLASSGDGLYETNNSYVYRGSNPNNYIMINNVLFRIVSIDENGNIKVVMNESLTKKSWNVNSLVNTKFDINSIDNIGYYLNYNPDDIEILENIKINSNVLEYNWNNEIFNYEKNKIYYELKQESNSEYTFSANIGLLYATEYIHASLNDNCINDSLRNVDCGIDNYLNTNKNYFTMSRSNNNIWAVSNDGKLYQTSLNMTLDIRPTVVLSNDIKLTGKGTYEKPYNIVIK